MKTAKLIRIDQTDAGTFGLLVTAGGWWYTMELPWKDNERSVSCIPCGEYNVVKTYSQRFERDLYILGHVTDRDGIRIHPANKVSQLEGCIALGNRMGTVGGKHLVGSGRAVKALHRVMGNKSFKLIVQEGI
jgi:hypothetical protein